ncbi:GNAT family N-acetyltransferase [Mesorhizobium mediterraneum]|uniref:GNAT family N-acetyltransferase n=1 Tax=Mesorhizobium mediterraneum TaxID=43617 RepID=UPI00177ECB07|nr:GNAT family N-acetyltransferase [Mesorhizobium mediterraneum]
MTESPKINIRPSEIDDLPALSRLIFRTIETSYSGVYPPRAIAFLKQFHSEEKVLQRIETGVTLVAEQDSQLIATASLDGQEITAVFVDPDRQRFGFGQLLMQDLEERGSKKRYQRDGSKRVTSVQEILRASWVSNCRRALQGFWRWPIAQILEGQEETHFSNRMTAFDLSCRGKNVRRMVKVCRRISPHDGEGRVVSGCSANGRFGETQ